MACLSIVIPTHNEEATLAEVVKRVYSVEISPWQKEVIISDDGSTDETPEIISGLREQYGTLRVHISRCNLGKGAAVRAGMQLATGELVLIQDADLELDPADYPKLLAPFCHPETTVVYGSRFLMPVAGLSQTARWSNRVLTSLTNLLFHGHLTDMETAYKVLRREVVGTLRLRCVRFDIEPEITARLLQMGYTITEVPVRYNPRTVAEGKKIRGEDGLDALYALVRCRLFP